MVKFLFDANAFITPFNIYYHPEIAPGFWLKLKNYFETRNFYTIKKVYEEILEKEDRLSNWMKELPSQKILDSENDAKVMEKYGELSDFLLQEYESEEEVEAFLESADAYLIAHAMADEEVVIVTFEKYSNSPTTPNIPAVCEKLNFNFSIALQQNYELIWEIKNLDHLSSCKCITLFEAMYLAGVRI
ncbi:MAG TPA: DUF4411 family protein [Candidatus Desulfofervidus auxilii]|uniref:DUF4411 family protein n=1 Tax=Desulfofervidus auxilii TaxID=1621989 RepID=A0A7C0U2W6_DESA2|nr:DUF4411 family protein [Candidatus Desulfofervidus auxilii]